MRQPALAFREALDSDRALVLDSWLASFRNAHAAGLIAMADWRPVMGPQVVRLLQRPGVTVLVAYHPGEDSGADAYGWAAVELRTSRPPLVLYAYTKQPYRRLGIARRLLERAGVNLSAEWHYAAKTGVVSKLGDKMARARWTPLAARYPPPGARTDGRNTSPLP